MDFATTSIQDDVSWSMLQVDDNVLTNEFNQGLQQKVDI